MTRTLGPGSVFPMLVLLGTAVLADESTLLPRVPAGKGETCVESTDVMRRDHMKFLRHQRDETVHRGIRGSRHSFAGCIDCHVQRNTQGTPIPVNAEGQFCQSCHGFAGVRMDCFECHASVPARGSVSARPKWMFPPAVSLSKAAGAESR